jgi:hypothetical protein
MSAYSDEPEASRRVRNFAQARKTRSTKEDKVHTCPRNCRHANQVCADNDLIGMLREDTVHATVCKRNTSRAIG